ncbi:hypothetical protein RN001_005348 [Aquatica leii]|uniref:Uncharacterized protein n=1 Tax=Aquatica leii TaxID=1421715 RepID=A0AAN7SIT2_9COLE|nr:hypothetical protein RN001_005348 [Aquatica leii]
MELLILSLIFSMIVSNIIAVPSSNDRRKRDEFDSDDAESFIQALATLPFENTVREEFLDGSVFPQTVYGPPALPSPTYGAPIPTPVGVGITIDKHAVLPPKVEIFRFLEAFLHFKTELIARLQLLINENWELLRAVCELTTWNLLEVQSTSSIKRNRTESIFRVTTIFPTATNIVSRMI